jgi:ABC-type uncharacterized transport system permease subunit
MLDVLLTPSFWSSAISGAGPIAFAAIASLLASRAGILFVGVEGTLLVSAFASLACASATGSLLIGVAGGVAFGMISALVFGVFSMTLGMGDVVAGLVLQILAIGVTGFLVVLIAPSGGLTVGSNQLSALWPSTGSPLADVFLGQPILVYLAVVCAALLTLFFRSRWGLRVRASGDSLRVSKALGLELVPLRFKVLVFTGLLTGLGGTLLGLGVVGTFSTTIGGGRGFIALACVILAAWRPMMALLSALIFSVAYTYGFQADQSGVGAYFQLLPYILVIVVIAVSKGSNGPVEEGRGLVIQGR